VEQRAVRAVRTVRKAALLREERKGEALGSGKGRGRFTWGLRRPGRVFTEEPTGSPPLHWEVEEYCDTFPSVSVQGKPTENVGNLSGTGKHGEFGSVGGPVAVRAGDRYLTASVRRVGIWAVLKHTKRRRRLLS